MKRVRGRRVVAALALSASLALLNVGAAFAAPPLYHMLPDGSNACKWWPAAGGSGGLGTHHARQEVNGNNALPMYMYPASPVGCMNMPAVNYPH